MGRGVRPDWGLWDSSFCWTTSWKHKRGFPFCVCPLCTGLSSGAQEG